MESDIKTELDNFIKLWKDSPQQTKKVFVQLKNHLDSNPDVQCSFYVRHGISSSLRATLPWQKDRQFFVIIDVIDDDPKNRWLSVCFYKDMISDPDEMGEVIPQGLPDEDGYCFDVDQWDKKLLEYLKVRMDEACHFGERNHV